MNAMRMAFLEAFGVAIGRAIVISPFFCSTDLDRAIWKSLSEYLDGK